jgi:AraC-like DNA-binding protein
MIKRFKELSEKDIPMDTLPKSSEEENLALRPNTSITASVTQPTGGGAKDPRVLINESIDTMDQQPLTAFVQGSFSTYDTYDGQNQTAGPDWYEIRFSEKTSFNCLEMTMGFAYRDGGWWTSIIVNIQEDDGEEWKPADNLGITPPYNFANSRAERRPYETYVLTFDLVCAKAVRVVGNPGGNAQFTSLARLAVYHRNLSYWNPATLRHPPVPYIFRLISPAEVWEISKNFRKLTNLILQIQAMENFLDQERFMEYWQLTSRNYLGEPELMFLIAEKIGWQNWHEEGGELNVNGSDAIYQPGIHRVYHNTLAYAVVPVILDDVVIATVVTEPGIILIEEFDENWHRSFADEHDIPWEDYENAIRRTPKMTKIQMEGALGLISMIVNSMASLAHRNLHLEQRMNIPTDAASQSREQKERLIRQAIDFMEENLEDDITVADVAKAVALSSAYFCVLFTELTSQNPSNFLIDLRIERAKEHLAQTDMSVMEICVALGYSPSYFSRIFKKKTGITPGEYARKIRGQNKRPGHALS